MQRHETPPVDLFARAGADALALRIVLEECRLPYRSWDLDAADAPALPPGFPDALGPTLTAAIVDHDTGVHVFGAHAAMQYLAEKSGRLLPPDPDGKYAALSWLQWFAAADPTVATTLDALEAVLTDRPWLSGAYSVADVAAWAALHGRLESPDALAHRPTLRRWAEGLRHRGAVRRAVAR
ncbi:MAG: hypothetical protein RIB46_04930 [Pseudomonadales bacterium]